MDPRARETLRGPIATAPSPAFRSGDLPGVWPVLVGVLLVLGIGLAGLVVPATVVVPADRVQPAAHERAVVHKESRPRVAPSDGGGASPYLRRPVSTPLPPGPPADPPAP